MIVLLDTSENLEVCSKELGSEVGELFTPLTRRLPKNNNGIFGIDSGCFASFNSRDFISLLQREHQRMILCKFIAVPDVVGSAIRTIECFNFWKEKLTGWPLALVAQDGQENLEIPWTEISSIFIGGSTEWKMSDYAAHIIKAAKIMDKWVHVGRVNTPGRFEYFEKLGADSIDGTGLSRYSHMREKIYKASTTPKLLETL